jgi:hypothetical protein
MIWLMVIFVLWAGHRDEIGNAWTFGAFLASIPTAIGGTAIFFAFLLFFALLGATKNGLTGNHTYTIEEAGFRHATESTDAITKWSGIDDIRLNGRAIYVRISAFAFCLIPKRVFASQDQFEDYFCNLVNTWKNAS